MVRIGTFEKAWVKVGKKRPRPPPVVPPALGRGDEHCCDTSVKASMAETLDHQVLRRPGLLPKHQSPVTEAE